MDLKSLTYTSVARPGLTDSDIATIHHIALDLNSLDGITGLLVFNGTSFLQVIEGAEDAINDLVVRLRKDPRHSEFKIEDERCIRDREFADWTMKLAHISTSYLEACDDIMWELPPELPAPVCARVLEITQGMSRAD
jgi:hypothetical protein